jgi:hypothetical protein
MAGCRGKQTELASHDRTPLLTLHSRDVHLNGMRAARLQDSLKRLTAAIRDVESELAGMKAECSRSPMLPKAAADPLQKTA